MVNCAAVGCNNASKGSNKILAKDVKGWHLVPYKENDIELRRKWLAAMKRDPPYPQKNENFVVCGLHFEDHCWKRDLQYELLGGEPKFVLLDDAVPSLFGFTNLPKKRTSSILRAENRMSKIHVMEACSSSSTSVDNSQETFVANLNLVTENVDVSETTKMISKSTQTEETYINILPEISDDSDSDSDSDVSEEELSADEFRG